MPGQNPDRSKSSRRSYPVQIDGAAMGGAGIPRAGTPCNLDPLTGLPNRALFLDRLAHTLRVSEREGKLAALMFIDLDGFKHVNDTLGHAGGDRLLREAAERFRSALRRSDTVARVGGDEFTVILPGMGRELEAVSAARKILDVLSEPFRINGNSARISGSLGIAVFPADGADAGSLLESADRAMYRAKESGKNSYRFYTAQMNVDVSERLRLERDLRRAVHRDEFEIYYQPVVDLPSGRVTGAEALIRWRHPGLGLLLPEEFLPAAEETGLAIPMGTMILARVCRQARTWTGEDPSGPDLHMNLSGRHCLHAGFANVLARTLEETGFPPERLVLEIHESLLQEEPRVVTPALQGIRATGVRVCIDDFGTGPISLQALLRHSIDMIKIDRRFLAGMQDSPEGADLVDAIIALGTTMKIDILGVGVEVPEQAVHLMTRGCYRAQGNLFCEPVPFPDFLRFASDSRPSRPLAV